MTILFRIDQRCQMRARICTPQLQPFSLPMTIWISSVSGHTSNFGTVLESQTTNTTTFSTSYSILSPKPPFTYYACRHKGHIARDCWQQQHTANYTSFDSQMSYYPEPSQFSTNAVFSNYYDQNWYVDSGTSSHLTGDSSNLDLDMYNSSGQTISTANGGSHLVQGSSSANVSSGSRSIKL